MSSPRFKSVVRAILLFLLLPFLSSCLHLKYGSSHDAGEYSILAKCLDIEGYLDLFKDVELGGIHTDEKFGYETIPSAPDKPFMPHAYLNFFHLSDVQLCDERAFLFGSLGTEVFDALVDSLRHGRDQEKYDYAVFKSILLGIDSHVKTASADIPSFLIHTGDSVHMSLMSELWEFLYLFDQSLKALPWFNVIGNHDVAVLGTPVSRNNVRLKNPSLAFLPVSSGTRSRLYDPADFIKLHKAGTVLLSGIPVLGPLKKALSPEVLSPDEFDPASTEFHGFDMLPVEIRHPVSGPEINQEGTSAFGGGTRRALKGYYAFDCRLKKNAASGSRWERVRVVVLNTSEHVSLNASGGVSESQIEWLEEMLEGLPDKNTRVIAFGHHPLIGGGGNMRTDREHRNRLRILQRLFEEHVDVYFCGHTHRQSFDHNHGFLQIMGPSLLIFPQTGQKVKIEYGQEYMRLRIVPFSHLEMADEDVLSRSLGQIAASVEENAEVAEAIKSIVSLWEEESYLKTRDINDILTLWKTDGRIKNLLDESIKLYGKDEEIKRSLSKAVLLKHAYLGRVGAMEDGGETVYSKLGTNYEFYIPLKKIDQNKAKLDELP